MASALGKYDLSPSGGATGTILIGGLCGKQAELLGDKYLTLTVVYEDPSTRVEPDEE